MNIDLDSYLDHQIIPFAIALYIIGVFLKKTAIIADRYIPWILLGMSCTASVFILGASVDSVIQGVLACGVAVLSNQLYKQTVNKD